MNKLSLYMFLCAAWLMMVCCGGSDDDAPGKEESPVVKEEVAVTLSQTEVTVPAEGGRFEVGVTTTGQRWSAATSAGDWLTWTSDGSDTPSGKITIKVAANEGNARSASIIVSSHQTTAKIAIEQEAVFKVSKTEVMTRSGGEDCSLVVSGRKEWTAASDADWVNVKRESETSLVITTLPATGMQTRSGKVTIAAGKETLTVNVRQEGVEVTEIQAPEGYELVWHDEFDEGMELNPEHWTHEVQKSGWVNNELQTYVNGEYNGKRVTEISDGKLRIHCFKAVDHIYSGRVYAHVDEGWKYGYIEARIMLPKGKGTWPAFWMMPVKVDWANEGWPKCGEIDIMEEVGTVPNEVSSSLHAEGHNHTNGTQVTRAVTIDRAEGDFHTYAIEWTATQITTYVDGDVLLTYDNDGGGVKNWPYDKPYYIILNLAWGGSWGGMNGVDESALPVSYVIDYVRVFQRK